MEVTNMATTTQSSRSFSSINMFKSKRSELTRTASRDLGLYATDENIDCAPLPPEEEVDSILMQLEDGLFGASTTTGTLKVSDIDSNISGNTVGHSGSMSYFPFQRTVKKEIDRSTSDQSMDPDQFLWANGKHENTAMPSK